MGRGAGQCGNESSHVHRETLLVHVKRAAWLFFTPGQSNGNFTLLRLCHNCDSRRRRTATHDENVLAPERVVTRVHR